MLTAWNKLDAYRVALVLVEHGFACQPLTIHRPREVLGPETGFAETARFIRVVELFARGQKRD